MVHGDRTLSGFDQALRRVEKRMGPQTDSVSVHDLDYCDDASLNTMTQNAVCFLGHKMGRRTHVLHNHLQEKRHFAVTAAHTMYPEGAGVACLCSSAEHFHLGTDEFVACRIRDACVW